MTSTPLTCAAAKELDLVDYLHTLGHEPRQIKGNDYWFLSPFREEQTASFKVDRKLNLWYDHGLGIGGDLIDFGTRFHHCSVKEFLVRLQHTLGLSFQQPHITTGYAVEKKKNAPSDVSGKINIISTQNIISDALKNYLERRAIPLELAERFCKEIQFSLYDKTYTVLGFPNRSGGYELRSENFKGSSSPKDVSLIDNKTENIAVFEGFFSFLSFQTINKNLEAPTTNCLVLNSLAFFEKYRSVMEQYGKIHLFLDNDSAGKTRTAKALTWSHKYIDRSSFYNRHKDLNTWLMQEQKIKQSLKKGFRKGL